MRYLAAYQMVGDHAPNGVWLLASMRIEQCQALTAELDAIRLELEQERARHMRREAMSVDTFQKKLDDMTAHYQSQREELRTLRLDLERAHRTIVRLSNEATP